MFAGIINALLSFAGGPVIDKVLAHLQKRADSEVEKRKIEATREATLAGYSRDVVVAGMQHRMFWVAWSIAAVPMAAWFGWGMLDTLFNGGLPDVAEIPPGLLPWAETVWSNLFYSGAAAAGLTSIGVAIAKRK